MIKYDKYAIQSGLRLPITLSLIMAAYKYYQIVFGYWIELNYYLAHQFFGFDI